MDKIKLNILGISYSQTQSGAYALVLNEEGGKRRIPIIVGGFEAQSIAIQLEGLNPPRPLTHDLFMNFAKAFNINLIEVIIYKLEEGVFHAKLICKNGDEELSLDSRTSDAVALALRFKCPIYTTEEIMAKAGVILDIEKENDPKAKPEDFSAEINEEELHADELKHLDNEELKSILDEAVKNENYERASEIRDELNKRKKNK